MPRPKKKIKKKFDGNKPINDSSSVTWNEIFELPSDHNKVKMFSSGGYATGYTAVNVLVKPDCMMTYWDIYSNGKVVNKDYIRERTFRNRSHGK